MSIEDTIHTWAAAWSEPDPARRTELIARCFADTGRFVSRGITVTGRTALAAYMAALHQRLPGIKATITSPIDVQGTLFRVRGIAERDGVSIGANWDAGEVDADHLIATVFTFAEPNPA